MELVPLVCLCLLSCSGETSAAGDGVRVVVEEDHDAVLPCSLSTKEDITVKTFDWKKDGQKEVFFYNSGIFTSQDQQFIGRVSHFEDQLKNGDASIKITKTKMADSGTYSCDFPNLQPRQTFRIELVVVGVRVVVKEGDDAVLPCSPSTKEDMTGKVFDWKKDGQKEVFMYVSGTITSEDQQFKGRVSHFEDQLKNGNASIKIIKTEMADSGTYSCIFPNLQPRQTFNIELVVGRVLKDRTGENITGAAPKPNIDTLDHTKDWILLQCKAHGDPPLTVEWKDSADNTLHVEKPQTSERESRSYITVNINVTKTDTYSCVATQKNISHQIAAVIPVYIQGAAPEPNIKTLAHTMDRALLQCEAHGDPRPTVEWKDSAGNTLRAEKPQTSERESRSYITVNITVTKTDTYRCVATQEEKSHQIAAVIPVYIQGSCVGAIVGAVLGPLLVVIILLAVLHFKGCMTLNCKKDKKKSVGAELTQLNSSDPEK